MKSRCGGRKRGRPAKLTPEQKREKERLRKAKNRRRIADAQWARVTNSARVIDLAVLHWLDLLDFLVEIGLLDQRNVENVPAIEDAVEDLLNHHLDELRAWREADATGADYIFRLPLSGPGPNFRPSRSGPGTVRFRIDLDDAEAQEIDIDDTRRITERLEGTLFRLYSSIEDWRRPDAYGIAWGSWNHGRGLHAYNPWKPKSEPEPTWTKAEVEEAKRKAMIVSETTLRMSMKDAREALEARERAEARGRTEIRERAERLLSVRRLRERAKGKCPA
jgi:hypothetical protein